MFEKEAENYSTDTYDTCLYDYLPYTNDSRAREESFKDGATFGYNKANEWHYIKNGDFPKNTKTVLALCIVGGEPYPYLAQYWKGSTTAKKNGVDLNWNCWLNNMQREVVEPYAWREIIPPKEIEEK